MSCMLQRCSCRILKSPYSSMWDPTAAAAARALAFADAAKQGYLIAPAHMSLPGVGHLRRDGKGYRFVPLPYLTITTQRNKPRGQNTANRHPSPLDCSIATIWIAIKCRLSSYPMGLRSEKRRLSASRQNITRNEDWLVVEALLRVAKQR